MQKRTAELISYLDATRARLVEIAGSINPAFAAMRPRDNAWSPEQIVAHVATVEERIAVLITKSVAWAKANGIGPATSDESMMSSLDKYGIADAAFKIEAPTMVVPDARPISESLASLAASRAQLKQALADGEGIDLSQVKRAHQAIGDIDMYQWALFVAQHEERHRRQIERTLSETIEQAAECAPIV